MDQLKFKQIINTIRSLQELTDEQKNNINTMNEEQKLEIIKIYDTVIHYLIDYINKYCK